MQIYYKDGFYFSDGFVPEGACEISEETYRLLIEGQSQGKQIVADEQGLPILIEPAPSPFHTLENGEWVLTEENQQAQFERHRIQLISKLSDQTDRLKSAILVGYPQAEIDSFYRQEREARGWKENNHYPTPMLTAIAENRGVPFEILVEKVIEKADQVAVVIGQIIGQRQAFEDRISLAKNNEELTAIEQEINQWQLAKETDNAETI
ncbi:hypothetical protein ACWIUA_00535 [Ursidibacter sp. B-7004-1]